LAVESTTVDNWKEVIIKNVVSFIILVQ
jgi:hypothetical protein